MQFRSYAPQALAARGLSHQSITEAGSIVNHWLNPVVGQIPLEDIQASHVASILDAVRESDASESRVRDVLAQFRAIMGQAVQERLIFRNPCDGFKVTVRKAQVNALTSEQRDKLDHVLPTQVPWTAAQPLLVMLWTGLRVSEVLALRPRDFDPEAKVLTVRSGKSDAAARRVDVPDCVASTLQSCLCAPERPHPTTLRRALSAACVAANVPPIRVHDLRHTRITSLLLAGVPVGYVSKQAGHANPATTLKTYDHWIQVASTAQRREWANA
jgi:integrase